MKKFLIVLGLFFSFLVNSAPLTGFSLKQIQVEVIDNNNFLSQSVIQRIEREAQLTVRSLANDYKYKKQDNFIRINIEMITSNFSKHRFFIFLQLQEKTELTGRLEKPTKDYVISEQYVTALTTKKQQDVYATIVDMLLTFSNEYLNSNQK
jgi:predicted GH43/DUF377 family glycosyl hydrolase